MSNIQHAHPALADALSKKGYTSLTPVQDAVLDPDLLGEDLLVSAQTGSGKTVAFGLAMASTLLGDGAAFMRADAPLALAIAPTRELALQVKRELDWLYKEAGVKTASCVGGMDMRDERRALAQGAHIVVGTPGRLCDHIKRGSLDMTELQAIVLDEADEMLKMGFREELEQILGAAPEERRTLMFSATVPKTILGMTKKYQRNAVRVNTAAEAKQHVDIEYRAMTVGKGDAENAIINVLRFYNAKNAIVFGDTRIAVNRMTQRFNNRGFSVVALSGELSQKERSSALQALRDGRAQVCIATDVAARGLDLPDLELVIHADVPKNREALLHRSGRTGRAGRKGVSALIVTPNRRRNAERVLKDANITAEWSGPPTADEIISRDNERLLGNMTLDSEVTEEERTMVKRLLKSHTPEHIATAFIRQYRAGQSAPEELVHAGYDGGNDNRGKAPTVRSDFDNGVWFSLNLGRKQKAEPKWILPMLLKSGGLKKADIGTIKITDTQTFFELDAGAVDGFIDTIGPDGKIEKAITATRISGLPDFNQSSAYNRDKGGAGRPKSKSYQGKGKKDYSDKREFSRKKDYGKKDHTDKPKRKPREESREGGSGAAPTSYSSKSNAGKFGEGKPKKPHKKKLARAAAKKDGGAGVQKGARKNTRKKDRR
ncbi:DEAD/DEAH box helicase [Litorimonas sp. RW-G-Af-16]|uniref:DEAD/DEAH box helicase n=1 Tax=Litorimonas sp. RW-G-Af-16 TaxID=3241168 RepID=UPI00390C7458